MYTLEDKLVFASFKIGICTFEMFLGQTHLLNYTLELPFPILHVENRLISYFNFLNNY